MEVSTLQPIQIGLHPLASSNASLERLRSGARDAEAGAVNGSSPGVKMLGQLRALEEGRAGAYEDFIKRGCRWSVTSGRSKREPRTQGLRCAPHPCEDAGKGLRTQR